MKVDTLLIVMFYPKQVLCLCMFIFIPFDTVVATWKAGKMIPMIYSGGVLWKMFGSAIKFQGIVLNVLKHAKTPVWSSEVF